MRTPRMLSSWSCSPTSALLVSPICMRGVGMQSNGGRQRLASALERRQAVGVLQCYNAIITGTVQVLLHQMHNPAMQHADLPTATVPGTNRLPCTRHGCTSRQCTRCAALRTPSHNAAPFPTHTVQYFDARVLLLLHEACRIATQPTHVLNCPTGRHPTDLPAMHAMMPLQSLHLLTHTRRPWLS